MSILIDEMKVSPGEKVRGALRVGELPDTSQIMIPVTIINGVKPGPTLSIISSVHGNEVNGAEICFRIANSIDPGELSGKLVIVPIANPLAYNSKVRNTPQDEKDMNRCFPGNNAGSITYKMAYAVQNSVIKESNFLVDIHSGSESFRMVPFVKIYDDSDSFVKSSFFGFKFAKVRKSLPGSLTHSAREAGVKSFCIETGEGGRLEEEYISETLTNVINFMKHLKMLGGRAKREDIVYLYNETRILSSKGGLIVPDVEVGQKIRRGTVLGEIHNPFTGEREEIRSKGDGWVVGIKREPQTYTGEKIFLIYH
jgi:predicted deacylase